MNGFHKLLVVALLLTAQMSAAQQPRPSTGSLSQESKAAFTTDTAVGSPYEWRGPKYPKAAKRNRVQGAVTMRLTLNEKGRVANVSVLSGEPELAEAAARAVRDWQYTPYFRNGLPVQVTTVVTVRFRLTDSGGPDITAEFAGYHGEDIGPVFKVGNGVSAPRLIHHEDPAYSEKARQEKFQGTCILTLVVGSDGRPHNIRVARALGEDLDGKAIEAVSRWTFSPAIKDGKPVAVAINVEVQFRLY